MNSYKYRITETLVREVYVQGNTIADAGQRIQRMYDEEDIVLTSDNHVHTHFQLVAINDEPIDTIENRIYC